MALRMQSVYSRNSLVCCISYFRRNLLLRQSIRYLHLYRNCFYVATLVAFIRCCTAVSSEAWAKLREWAVLAGKGRLLLSGNVVLASLKAPVH